MTCATAVVDVISTPNKVKNWSCGNVPNVTPGSSSKGVRKSRCRKLVEGGEPNGLVSNSTKARPLPVRMKIAPTKPYVPSE